MEPDKIILQIQDKKTQEIEFVQLHNIKDLNHAIREGLMKDIVNMSEILMDKRIDAIANEIIERPNVKVILVAGPSSKIEIGRASCRERV